MYDIENQELGVTEQTALEKELIDDTLMGDPEGAETLAEVTEAPEPATETATVAA